jgi:hypothetical protein
MHCRTAWGDYFPGTPTLLQGSEYSSRPTTSDSSIYVLKCLFISITSSSSGGALYCSSMTYFLVELSSFFSCKSSSHGGAICVYSGQYVLYGVCGYDCYSTTGGYIGQFSYNSISSAISIKNYINYSSITRCGSDIASLHYIVCHHGGNNCYPSVNVSMNKCTGRTGIYFCPYKDTYSVTGSISYSTLADNHATGYNCIKLCTEGANFEIKSCNIIRNKQPYGNTEGMIYTYGITVIKDCCILENIATYIFHQYSSSYSITLSNCTVDSTSINGYLTIQKTVTKSFIHALNHMSTRNCHSEYDSAGYLTPNIQTPSPSKKQRDNCSCGNFFLYPRLRDVISLTSILFFNFIHPYASIDFFY